MNICVSSRRSEAGFTMVEIALALAVIGFALVAIVGVLPQGLTIQKNNREDTLVSQDGPFLIEAIRSGAKGVDALSNNVAAMYLVVLDQNGNRLPPQQVSPAFLGDSASNIVGVLSIPVGTPVKVPGIATPGRLVEAYTVLRPLGGSVVEHAANLNEFAFRYVVASQVIAGPNSTKLPPDSGLGAGATGLNSVSLKFVWPVGSWADSLGAPGGTGFLGRFSAKGPFAISGRGDQVFRSEFAGSITSPPLIDGTPNEVTYFANPLVF